jgi:hypothetical protein
VLFAALLNPPQPYDWTTDPTILAWISVTSLIIGALGIVVGIGIGYWFYLKSKNWRRVVYEVISDTPIMSVREQTRKGKIKVTYEASGGDAKELNDARLLILKLWNAGNGDVIIWKAGDKDVTNLEEPIQFEFEGRTVVDITNVKTDPPENVIKQEYLDEYLNSPLPTPTCVCLPRCLLKQNQSLQLGILFNGPSGNNKLKVGKLFNGEIIDIYAVERRTNIRNWLLKLLSFLLGLVLVMLSLIVYPSRGGQIVGWIIISYIVWMTLVAFAPFSCKYRYCGYQTWNPLDMRKHLETYHGGIIK